MGAPSAACGKRPGAGLRLLFPLQAGVAHRAAVACYRSASSPVSHTARLLRLISASALAHSTPAELIRSHLLL
ncbi:hypothetical protein JCM30197_14660 [Schleiferia thermophila]|nr:hypothetical protein JCM30197_14660 [Schleiferia thermophila]